MIDDGDKSIEQDHEGWWFTDETWAYQCGPYPSRDEALRGLEEYARTELDGKLPTLGYRPPPGLRWR